jgi:hypothetical protein
VTRLEGRTAVLKSGARIEAEFLVLGVGVRPAMALAEQAGLKVDRGVVVNDCGMMIPTEGEVMWLLAGGPHTYWRACIRSATYD